MLVSLRHTATAPGTLRRIAGLVLAGLSAALPVSAEEVRPPQPAAPPSEARRFGSWELVCERAATPTPPEPSPRKPEAAPSGKAGDAGPAPACKVVQRQVARETGQSQSHSLASTSSRDVGPQSSSLSPKER